jgi:hypothetical protein
MMNSELGDISLGAKRNECEADPNLVPRLRISEATVA